MRYLFNTSYLRGRGDGTVSYMFTKPFDCNQLGLPTTLNLVEYS